MTDVLNLKPTLLATIMSDSEEKSYIPQYGFNYETTTTFEQRIVRTLNSVLPQSHTFGGADKVAQDHLGPDIEVNIYDYYDLFDLQDSQAESEEATFAAVERRFPNTWANALNKVLFGAEFWPANHSAAVTTNEVEVDGTPAGFLAALEAVPEGSLFILDKRYRGAVRAAYASDANTNALRDGEITELAGVPVVWTSLNNTTPVAGDHVGMLVDASKVVVVAGSDGTVTRFTPQTDQAAFKANKWSAGARFHVGTGIRSADDAVLLTVAEGSL